MSEIIVYQIPAPYSTGDVVEVYGQPDMGWYEWRLVSHGRVLKDSRDMAYGVAEIALRDALVFCSGDE